MADAKAALPVWFLDSTTMKEWLPAIGSLLGELAAGILRFASENTYLALIVVLLIEEAGVPLPVPGDTIILYAGYQISVGRVNPIIAGLCVIGATLAGATILYWIGRLGGHNFVFKYGKYVHLDQKKLVRMERWYQEHQAAAIILGRLVPGLRIATTVVAGIFEVSYWPFALYTTISAIIWAAIYLTAGAVLGREYDHLSAYVISLLGRPVVRGLLIIVALAAVGWMVFRRRPGWFRRDDHEREDGHRAEHQSEASRAPSRSRR